MVATVARRYFVRGREQLRAGDLESAAQAFAAALELVPSFVEARVGAALTLAKTDPPRAAHLLRSGLADLARPGPRRMLLVALGDVLVAGGDFPGADEAYVEAARLPGRHPLTSRLCRLHAKRGRYGDAIAALRGSVTAPTTRGSGAG